MIKEIRKIIKVELNLIKLNLETVLTYRTNFLLIFIGAGFYNIGALLFITYLFSKIPLITGWDRWDLIFLYGIGQTFGYIFLFSTSPNNHNFHKLIETGDFDLILIKPINSIIYSTLNVFNFEFLLSLLQPAAIIIYVLVNKSYEISILGIFVAITSFFISFIIIHLLNVITLIPTFWALKNQFFRLFAETSNISNYPYEIFDNRLIRLFFFTIIPYGLIINIPFRAILGKIDLKLFLLLTIVCIGFVIATRKLWKWGLKNYTSVSS